MPFVLVFAFALISAEPDGVCRPENDAKFCSGAGTHGTLCPRHLTTIWLSDANQSGELPSRIRPNADCVAYLYLRTFHGMGKDSLMTATGPAGRSVFLVEDEVMIRMMVADMLEELGYKVAAEAGDIAEAMRLAQSAEFDLAILDVNVNGKVISPVADLIKAKGRPFIFATGYGSSGLPEQYRDRPALQKPFQIDALGKTIETALRGA
jgi:CheY-like chemotaxis protein